MTIDEKLGKHLDMIEILLADIERVDAITGGKYRQTEDREALDIVLRALRKLRRARKAP